MAQPDPSILRTLIACYRKFLAHLEAMRQQTTDIAELFGIAAVFDEITEKLARTERRLARLERTA